MWQDWVMSFMSLLLSMAAYKQVYFGFKNKAQKIAKYTAISTAVCLFGYAYVYSTLGCVFAVIVSCSTGLAWAIIIFQVFRYGRDFVVQVKVTDEEVWKKIKNGEIACLSIGGTTGAIGIVEENANCK